MSETQSSSRSPSSTSVSASASDRPTWWREPLVHFLMLGALLFALDRLFAGDVDAARTIYVDAEVDREAREVFAAARDRDPDEDELLALRRVWLDNEVLYREGLELGLDKGDETIRERVIFKTLNMINVGLTLPVHDDATLRAWFEENRSRYDEPARFDFHEAVLSGNPSDGAIAHFVEALNAGTPGEDMHAGLRVFTGRPRDNLVHSYGDAFVAALEALEPGEWHALPSKEGLRAINLVAIAAPEAAEYDELRGIVRQDWVDATMAEKRTTAGRALAKKYTIKAETVASE